MQHWCSVFKTILQLQRMWLVEMARSVEMGIMSNSDINQNSPLRMIAISAAVQMLGLDRFDQALVVV